MEFSGGLRAKRCTRHPVGEIIRKVKTRQEDKKFQKVQRVPLVLQTKNYWTSGKKEESYGLLLDKLLSSLNSKSSHRQQVSCESTEEYTSHHKTLRLYKFHVCPQKKTDIILNNLKQAVYHYQEMCNLEAISKIVYNERCHLVSAFKDFLINDDSKEFLYRKYSSKDFRERIGYIAKYYETFNKPTLALLEERKILEKGMTRKEKVLGIKEEDEKGYEPGSKFLRTQFMQELAMEDLKNSRSFLPSDSLLKEKNDCPLSILLQKLNEEDGKGIVLHKKTALSKCLSDAAMRRKLLNSPIESKKSCFSKVSKPHPATQTTRNNPTIYITKNKTLPKGILLSSSKLKLCGIISKSCMGNYKHKNKPPAKPANQKYPARKLFTNSTSSRNYYSSTSPPGIQNKMRLARTIHVLSTNTVPLHISKSKSKKLLLQTLRLSLSPRDSRLSKIHQILSSVNSIQISNQIDKIFSLITYASFYLDQFPVSKLFLNKRFFTILFLVAILFLLSQMFKQYKRENKYY